MQLFTFYLIVYSFLAFLYIWYRYASIMVYNPIDHGNHLGKVSVIIPFYNEDVKLLERTVIGIANCYGEKEIIIIDDGSKSKDCYNALLKLKKKIDFKLIRYEKNRGKRYAQCLGFEEATCDIIMTLDSDTVLDRNAVINLIKPFSDPKVGATTGQLGVLNKNKNLLTRLQAARYWNAFNFERKSQSSFASVICCSGPISAYRASLIKRLIPSYKNQKFMGQECTFGDDRHLTTLVLKNNYNVLFVSNAMGYTDVPDTLSKFIKQQIRWKKSWLRETILVSKFMFKKGKWGLSFEVTLTTLITFFSLFARISLIVGLILNPAYIVIVIPMLLFMSSLHSLYILFNKPKYFGYSLIYGFFHTFVVYWLVYVAIFSFRDIRWSTR